VQAPVLGAVGGTMYVGLAAASSLRSECTPGSSAADSSASMSSTAASFGNAARSGAILREYKAVVVTSTRATPSLMRVSIGSGPKAGNNGQKTASAFHVPSAAT
jgi:hypothetical protein